MNEDDFIKQVKSSLDEDTEALDAETLSRLNRSRQAALQQLDKKTSWFRMPTWIPATGGLATVLLLSTILLFKAEEIAVVTDDSVVEMEIIAAQDSLELYEQLDFYMWMAEEESSAS